MNKTLLGMRKAQERNILPAIDLFPQFEYNGRTIDAAVFGSRGYNENVSEMRKRYFHSRDLPDVTFKPLTTAESLAVAGYDFRNLAKPTIFDPVWLQAGHALRTKEGVWINPLKDDKGNLIMEDKELEQCLGKENRIHGIYLFDDDTSFVPYDSFKRGVQEHGDFLEGGLARGLVHTTDKNATTLSSIANNDEYPNGVRVGGFDFVERPTLRVIGLCSDRLFDDNRLDVYGDWLDSYYGVAFGGLVSGEAGAQKI